MASERTYRPLEVVKEKPYTLYVNDTRTVLVRVWPSGTVEVCSRNETGDYWGPPIVLKEDL